MTIKGVEVMKGLERLGSKMNENKLVWEELRNIIYRIFTIGGHRGLTPQPRAADTTLPPDP